jgi:putative peptidoglycan lipid II flippase
MSIVYTAGRTMSRKLLTSTAITGGMTLVSRISGLIRDMAFASLIGAGTGVAADAFYVAFRIPNFLRRIFGEGAFSQAFVPVFSEYRTRAQAQDTRDFLGHVIGALGTILLAITVIGVLAAPILVFLLAPGFLDEPEKFDLTVGMLRVIFPYIFFISLVAMAAGVLNSYGRFAAAAFTPVLLNLCLIAAALLLAPMLDTPVMALAWGVFFAGLMQVLFQLPFLKSLGLLPRPRIRIRPPHEGVSRVFRLMLPAIFGVSIAQVNLLVNTLLASFLVTGSVSWLYYSDRLMEFPLGVFGIALATVILPSLSRRHVANAHDDFSHLLDWGLRWVCLIGIPSSVALVVLAGPMLATLFHFGAFGEHDVRMSAQALMAFSGGLLAFILVKVLAPGFYARQDTRTPMRIGVVAMLTNIVLSLALVWPFAHVGLAAAVSVAAFVNAGLLFHRLYRDRIYRPLPGWTLFLARVVIGTTAMGALLYWGTGDLGRWLQAPAWTRAGWLLFWVAAGLLVYLAATIAMGLRPSQLLLRRGSEKQHDD